MPFIKLFVVFVALGLSILIFTASEGVASLYLSFRLLCYLNFPPGLPNVIIPYSSCASILNFPLSLFFYISCCSSVTQLSSVFLFELPAAIITVIITQCQLFLERCSTVGRASLISLLSLSLFQEQLTISFSVFPVREECLKACLRITLTLVALSTLISG